MKQVALLTSLVILTAGLAAAQGEEMAWKNERIAARQVTVVSINEGCGIPMMFTYAREPEYWLHNIALGKLRVAVVAEDGLLSWIDEAQAVEVHNLPTGEGVFARAIVAGHTVTVEALPTSIGMDTMAFEGGALFKITCDPPAPIVARYGSLGRVGPISRVLPNWPRREEYLSDPELMASSPSTQTCHVDGSIGTLSCSAIPLDVAVRFECPEAVTLRVADSQIWAETGAAASTMHLLATFAETPQRAGELNAGDLSATETACRTHFRELAASAHIKTPVLNLDKTFEASLFNLEYGWVRPYGWIEGIHHWGTFYSQQMNLAADWIGQEDRSREMLLTHAGHLMPSGQVPQLDTSDRARVDFGGWNQFYVWGIQHYWRQTGDHEFIEQIWEPLNRVVNQTFAEHDPDGDGLLAFGQQIGNQEDYISTPRDGASPTMAAIEMLRIQAELAKARHMDGGDVAAFEQKARWMTQRLRETLWMPDLGRFSFFKDRLGITRLDGQYHTMIWPVLYDFVDTLGGYTSMRHLADVMTSGEGEVYTSRNFPYPVVATVGSQAGGQQQPWGTMGWAKLGDGDRAIRSMEWIADQVMSPHMQGAWPEVNAVSPQTDAVYFTPPAGVYIQTMIEYVFGLNLNKPAGVLNIEPSIPSSWPEAALHLPAFDLSIQQQESSRTIHCVSHDAIRHRYRVPIPPATGIQATLNGVSADFTVSPGIRCMFIEVDAGNTPDSILALSWEPLDSTIEHPDEVTSPGTITVLTGTMNVARVVDPCGVLASSEIRPDRIGLSIREGVAEDATLYGKRGETTLTKRTVFLEATTGESPYWVPVDFAVRPRIELVDKPALVEQAEEWSLHLAARDIRSGLPVTGKDVAKLTVGSRPVSQIESRDDALRVPLSKADLEYLTPGMNPFEIELIDGHTLTGQFDTLPLMLAREDLRTHASNATQFVPLPPDSLSPDTEWHQWRPWFAFGHPPWCGAQPPLSGLPEAGDLEPTCAPGLRFLNPERRLTVVSHEVGRPALVIPADVTGRKIYLLVMSLTDNHDVFSPVAQISARTSGNQVYERTVYFPGDLDWFAPPSLVGGFATYGQGWNDNLAWETPSSILNILELDLGRVCDITSLTVEAIGEFHGLAIAGVSVIDLGS